MPGSGYWFQGQRYDMNSNDNTDGVGQPGGAFWRESHALSDPTSGFSTQNYYGGEAGADARDFDRARDLSRTYGARAPVTANFAPSAEVRAGQMRQLGQVETAMRGDPNSVAQGQLSRGYDERAQMLRGGIASTRGGAANEALMMREGQGAIGAGEGQRAGAAAELMARERLAARGQYGALVGAMRGQDTSDAFGQADLEAQSRAADDKMRLAYENQALDTARMGMQGRRARQIARQSAWDTANGQNNRQREMQNQADAFNTNTAIGVGQGAVSTAGSIWNMARDDKPGPRKGMF